MRTTEHTAKTPAANTGRFAVAFALLRAKGSGAPSIKLLATLALVVLLAFTAAPAHAVPAPEFGTAGPGAGQFFEPKALAVDQQTGDVYVADRANNRVDRFSESGTFQLAFGWGVRDGAAELQVCGPQAPLPTTSCLAGTAGGGEGQLAGPQGIAVDNDPSSPSRGDVYVEDNSNSRIVKFTPAGEFLLAFGEAGTGPGQFSGLAHGSLAVSTSTGEVYVADTERVQRFSPTGTLEVTTSLPGVFEAQLAVDSAGDLYLFEPFSSSGVHKYDPAGTELGSPRDPGLEGLESSIAIGPGDELIVSDVFKSAAILTYNPSGAQLTSRPLPTAASGASAGGGIAFSEPAAATYILYQNPPRVLTAPLPEAGVPFVLPGSENASEVGTTTATLNATLNPEGGEETTYRFQYGTAAGVYPQETPVEPLGSGEGFEDIAASKAISGLAPATTYHFRVLATNKAGEIATGPDQSFETLPPVSIDSLSVSGISATAATFEALLNPHGLPSTYQFEYGTTTAYGGKAPFVPGSLGEGEADVARTVQVTGLLPATTYHFRVLATNALGSSASVDLTFTTQPASASAQLPDGRGYELVSPPDKHGVPLEGLSIEGGIIQAAANGDGLAYFSLGAIDADPAGNRSSKASQLLATRNGPGAWTTADIATPHHATVGVQVGSASEYHLFSQDLSLGVVQPFGSTPLSPLATEFTPYLRNSDGTYTPLVYPGNVPEGTKFGGEESKPEQFRNIVNFVTGTPDLRHVLLSSPTSLVEGFSTEGKASDYEWSEGQLTPISLIPSGSDTVCGGSSPACISTGEAGHVSVVGNKNEQVRNAISSDGFRVVFATNTGKNALYLRDLARGETVQVDAAEPTCGAGCESGGASEGFQLASADGSRVFFTDANRLTADSTAASAKPDLYMCEVEVDEEEHLACGLTDLSANTVDPAEPANVQGVVIGASEDGSSVYLVANGALTAGEGAVPGDCHLSFPGRIGLGQCNLYRYDVVSGDTRLIAVLSGADFPDWHAGDHVSDLGLLTSRVSPDGRYLAFMSQRPLTGYDNRDAKTGERDEEVFLYDSQTETLRCASCDPSGARPTGVLDQSIPGPLIDRPHAWESHWLAASIPGWVRVDEGHALYQPRYLSDSGRLFFNSASPLSPSDVNGTQDVYQYEPPGIGGCTQARQTFSAQNGGCLDLISSGTSKEESAFLDASESGDDVFFLTTARLTPKDIDDAYDVYDARVGGGEPAIVKPVECSGDACQQPAVPPNDATPGSLTFDGPGNLKQCPKGKKLKGGKCVKQKSKKHKKGKHKKHHKKKGHKKQKPANSNHGGHR